MIMWCIKSTQGYKDVVDSALTLSEGGEALGNMEEVYFLLKQRYRIPRKGILKFLAYTLLITLIL
jgi:hypothetical protein